MNERELAIGNTFPELVIMVARLLNWGYEPEGDMYITDDGYQCQPMILIVEEQESLD